MEKNKVCQICIKEGNIAKVCKLAKAKEKMSKKSHIRRIEEEASEKSEEETDTGSSNSEESSAETESDENLDETSSASEQNPDRKTKNKRMMKNKRAKLAKISEKPKRAMSKELISKITEVRPKSNDTIELKMWLSGKQVKVILDTGSPISIISTNMREWIRPNVISKLPTNRQFVDLNDSEVSVTGIYEVETKLFDKTENLDW